MPSIFADGIRFVKCIKFKLAPIPYERGEKGGMPIIVGFGTGTGTGTGTSIGACASAAFACACPSPCVAPGPRMGAGESEGPKAESARQDEAGTPAGEDGGV